MISGFESPSRNASRDVGAGARVAAHAGEHDPPERVVRLAVPARLSRCRSVLPGVAGSGATPHRFAHAASERTRFALSPAATNKIAAVSIPTPSSSTRLGRGRTHQRVEVFIEACRRGLEVDDLATQYA